MKNDKIEHGELKLMIDNLQDALSSRFNSLSIEIKASNELAKQTLEQARKTNGRVTKLEEKIEKVELDIEFIRFFRRKKWILAMLFLAFLYAYDNFKLDWILKKLGL